MPNTRNEIRKRNAEFLMSKLGMSEQEWLNFLKHKVGAPINDYTADWTPDNPARGWCNGVSCAFYYSGNMPEGYSVCKQREDAHYYFINPSTKEVIDLTLYQSEGEYPHEYTEYNRTTGYPVFSKNLKKIMNALNWEIDKTKFTINVKNGVENIKRR